MAGKIKSAHLWQHVHRIGGVRLVQRDGIRNDLLLLPEGVVGNAAAPAGDLLHAEPPAARQRTAEDVVVLPMPISPTPMASASVCMASSAPVRMA